MEIAEVIAAIVNSTKKEIPKKYAPGSFASDVVKTLNINPGPPAGSPPAENTTVKIATPAKIAMNVSRNTMM